MKFEYTAHLKLNDKIKVVEKEILDNYPLISEEEAHKAAALTSYVNDKLTNDDKFYRFYHILKIIGIESPEFDHVFNDLYNLYEEGFEKEINNKFVKSLIKYMNNEISEFPEYF